MAVDPICGMTIREESTLHFSTYAGKTYYFCSFGCKQAFDNNPPIDKDNSHTLSSELPSIEVITPLVSPQPPYSDPDKEQRLAQDFIDDVARTGCKLSAWALIDIYISLKANPFLVLSGPPGGKKELLHCLAWILTSDDSIRYQRMVGHPWWANSQTNFTLITEAQTRLNTSKLLALIEEAKQPENAARVYIANLTNISAAELASLWHMAKQFQTGRLTHLFNLHLNKSISFPANVLLLGTETTKEHRRIVSDYSPELTIIPWVTTDDQRPKSIPPLLKPHPYQSEMYCEVFLQSCIRDEQSALQKLHYLFPDRQLVDQPLLRIKSAFSEQGEVLPETTIRHTLIYLANAWTQNAKGLFDPDSSQNLSTALDYAILKIIVPQVRRSQRPEKILDDLRSLVSSRL